MTIRTTDIYNKFNMVNDVKFFKQEVLGLNKLPIDHFYDYRITRMTYTFSGNVFVEFVSIFGLLVPAYLKKLITDVISTGLALDKIH